MSDLTHAWPRRDDGTRSRKYGYGSQYSEWHRKLGHELCATDVDWMEIRFVRGKPVVVGIIETTMAKDGREVDGNYLAAVLERFNCFGMQGQITRMIAEKFSVSAFVVVYHSDMSIFWVYNLTQGKGWYMRDQIGYVEFLRRLQPK